MAENRAIEWSRAKTDPETILYRLVKDGYRLKVGEDGKLKLGRYDGEKMPLGSGLRQSLRENSAGIKSLLEMPTDAEFFESMQGIHLGLCQLYNPCVGCDLSPALDLIQKGQDRAEAGDVGGWRYMTFLGCSRALRIIDRYKEAHPLEAEQPEIAEAV